MPSERGATRTRVVTGFALLAVVAALVWAPGLHWAFTIFVALLAGIGLHEFFTMVQARGLATAALPGIVAGVAVAVFGYRPQPVGFSFALAMSLLVLGAYHVGRGKLSLPSLATSVFGVVYVGWLGAHVVALHGVDYFGPGLVSVLLLAIIASDTGAFVAGKTLGRHKLAPAVSPKKTWEGSIGGVLLAAVAMALLYALQRHAGVVQLPDWSLPHYLWLGVLLAIVGQVGDLVESMLKRDAKVKDSGGIFPGHGGVLDRCDGVLFAAPVFYYIILP